MVGVLKKIKKPVSGSYHVGFYSWVCTHVCNKLRGVKIAWSGVELTWFIGRENNLDVVMIAFHFGVIVRPYLLKGAALVVRAFIG